MTPAHQILSRPVSAAWTLHRPKDADCINEGTVMFAGGIVNTVADFLVTIVPIPLIIRLRMPRSERIGVTLLLSLGFFITIAGIIRTYFIWLTSVKQDVSWYSYGLFVAATVEVDVGIVSSTSCRHNALLYIESLTTPTSSAPALLHFAHSWLPPSVSSTTPSALIHTPTPNLTPVMATAQIACVSPQLIPAPSSQCPQPRQNNISSHPPTLSTLSALAAPHPHRKQPTLSPLYPHSTRMAGPKPKSSTSSP